MGNYDFSKIRDMVELFGMPQDVAESMIRSFEQGVKNGVISDKRAKKLQKDMNWSVNKFAKSADEYIDVFKKIECDFNNFDISVDSEDFLIQTRKLRKNIELHRNTNQNIKDEILNEVAIEHDNSEQIEIVKKNVNRLIKDSIECVFDYDGKVPVSLGMSKFGGRPHVYKDFKWPYTDDSEPLTFFFQINCAEISKYDKDSLLPDEGILYFFYNFKGDGSMTGGMENEYKVMYYPETHSVFPREYPDDYRENCIFGELALTYKLRESVPNFEEFNLFFNTDKDYVDEDDYFSVVKKYFPDAENDESVTKLLGYADCTQQENLSDCELEYRLRKNIKTNYSQFTKEQYIEFIKSSKEWVLLFQLDSILNEDMFLTFGDGGRVYYYIMKKDLLNRDFSKCIICEQCY